MDSDLDSVDDSLDTTMGSSCFDESFDQSMTETSTRGADYWKRRALEAERLLAEEKRGRLEDNRAWEAKWKPVEEFLKVQTSRLEVQNSRLEERPVNAEATANCCRVSLLTPLPTELP